MERVEVAHESGAEIRWSARAPDAEPGDPRSPGRMSARVLLACVGLLVAACGGSDVDTPADPGDEPAIRVDPVTGYHYGANDYVEWHPGTLPIVISAPHGGGLTPNSIPDRTSGVTVRDTNTRETILAVEAAIRDRFGADPHIVISNLRRTKLDPNREIVEAAQGSPDAERAWTEYHAFIDSASMAVEGLGGGIYIDLHGHGHDIQRLELGYLVTSSELEQSDAELDELDGVGTSFRELAARTDDPFSDLLRGAESIGGLFEDRGFPSVPSPDSPDPGGAPYFSGGYSTDRHGSRYVGPVDGVQFELNWEGVRNLAANRAAFAEALADVLEIWLERYY